MALPAPDPTSTVIVTGASSGLGAALARELAARGHGVTLVARRRDALRRLAAEIEADHPVAVRTHVADLAKPKARRTVVRAVEADGLGIAGLCNNAGVGKFGPFHEEDPEWLNALVALNVNAVHELTLAVLPGMVERGEGAVLNVASILGFGPLPTNASYSASKAFVINLSEAIHTELHGTGVSCTAFSPGPVRTGAVEASGAEDFVPFQPDVLFADAEAVARAGVDAMEDGRRSAIPGLVNRLLAAGNRHLPRTVTLPLELAASRLSFG
jgi:short-subunit dehydrogenase